MARVGAVLRRVRPALAGEQLAYADIEMDVAAHRVRRAGEAVQLGPTEFRLLRHFLEHPGPRLLARAAARRGLGRTIRDIDARTVDVHVRRLRQALERRRRAPDLIRTVRSAGYSLDAKPDRCHKSETVPSRRSRAPCPNAVPNTYGETCEDNHVGDRGCGATGGMRHEERQRFGASRRFGAQQITGAGSTFVYPVLSAWAADYQKQSGTSVNYQSIGSGGGIAQIKAGTVDFGATDQPLDPQGARQCGPRAIPGRDRRHRRRS